MPVMTLTEAARELGYATRSQLKRSRTAAESATHRKRRPSGTNPDRWIARSHREDHQFPSRWQCCQSAPKAAVDEWTEIAAVVDRGSTPALRAPPFSGDRLATSTAASMTPCGRSTTGIDFSPVALRLRRHQSVVPRVGTMGTSSSV